MRTVAGVVAGIVALLSVAILAATPASAHTGAPYRLETKWSDLHQGVGRNYGTDVTKVPVLSPRWRQKYSDLNLNQTAEGNTTKKYIWKASNKGRYLPYLRTLGTISLIAGAWDLGWTIGRGIDTHWLHLSGDLGTNQTFTAGVSTYQAFRWVYRPSGVFDNYNGTPPAPQTPPVWQMDFREVPSGTIRTGWRRNCNAANGGAACNPIDQAMAAAAAAIVNLPNSSARIIRYGTGSFCDSSTYGAAVECITLVAAADWTGFTTSLGVVVPPLEQAITVNKIEEKNGQSRPNQTNTSYTVPADLGQTTDKAGVRDSIDDDPSHKTEDFFNDGIDEGSVDPEGMPDCYGITYNDCSDLLRSEGWLGTIQGDEATKDEADLGIGPSAVIRTVPAAGVVTDKGDPITIHYNPDPMPILIPGGGLNEEYEAYLLRLQGMGWTGVATRVDLPESFGDTRYGPNAVPRTDPPEDDRVFPDEPITFYVNPPTFIPVPDGPDTGTCDGWLEEDFDLSPLMDLPVSQNFPFSIFGYITGVLGWITVAPDAPRFEFDIPLAAAMGGGEASYNVDLNIADPYMNMVRTILAVFLWIGAIVYFGAMLMGFRTIGPGDEMADDF